MLKGKLDLGGKERISKAVSKFQGKAKFGGPHTFQTLEVDPELRACSLPGPRKWEFSCYKSTSHPTARFISLTESSRFYHPFYSVWRWMTSCYPAAEQYWLWIDGFDDLIFSPRLSSVQRVNLLFFAQVVVVYLDFVYCYWASFLDQHNRHLGFSIAQILVYA